jgi:hypothetical protein
MIFVQSLTPKRLDPDVLGARHRGGVTLVCRLYEMEILL